MVNGFNLLKCLEFFHLTNKQNTVISISHKQQQCCHGMSFGSRKCVKRVWDCWETYSASQTPKLKEEWRRKEKEKWKRKKVKKERGKINQTLSEQKFWLRLWLAEWLIAKHWTRRPTWRHVNADDGHLATNDRLDDGRKVTAHGRLVAQTKDGVDD